MSVCVACSGGAVAVENGAGGSSAASSGASTASSAVTSGGPGCVVVDRSIVQLALGGSHTCALKSDGTVLCWGLNVFGELGDGTTEDHDLPTAVPGLTAIAEIGLGAFHSCARTKDGQVWCWGDNGVGQVGAATAHKCAGLQPMYPDPCTPRPLAVPGLANVIQIAVGDSTTCALEAAGTVWCWGQGALGTPAPEKCGVSSCSTKPLQVPGLAEVVAITNNGSDVCARKKDSTVWCWGSYGGMLGDGTTAERPSPEQVPALAQFQEIVLGAVNGCGRTPQGALWWWGGTWWDDFPRNGSPYPPQLSPKLVPGLADVGAFAIGGWHFCAAAAGGLYCWGNNAYGQLGIGPASVCPDSCQEITPQLVPGLPAVVELALGGAHSCARTCDGSVWCWGANEGGQLGDGTTVDRPYPVQIKLP